MEKKYDQWRYITLMTDMRTYDYIFNNREDALDFITGINRAILERHQYDYEIQIKKIGNDKRNIMTKI